MKRCLPCILLLTACGSVATPDGASGDAVADTAVAPGSDATTADSAAVDAPPAPIDARTSDVQAPPRDAAVDVRPADAAPPPMGGPALEEEVLRLVNEVRARGATCGGVAKPAVGPLQMNEQLRTAARLHSADMASNGYFDHTGLDGSTPTVRAMRAGYTGSGIGENIAAGNATAAATMMQWMNSTGHCNNIMNGSYRVIGIGYANNASSRYRHYWTQMFGR